MRRPLVALWLFLVYGAFVVYGSLVPLDFQPMPLDAAWVRFQQIPYLELGVGSRADWVANGVLYAPLAFLGARLVRGQRATPWLIALPLVVAACLALAAGVEFAQLFFPPRTVSQNDLIAEGLGSLVGALAAPALAGWLDRLAAAWLGGGGALLGRRLLELGAVGYVLLCFFPYDLLLSVDELADKWRGDGWAWWLAPSERGLAIVALQLVVEAALSLLVGALLVRHSWPGRIHRPTVLAAGLLLGLGIEIGQFFVASGVSQGASVLSRVAGVAAGAALMPWWRAHGLRGARRTLQAAALPLLMAYLPTLLLVNGYFSRRWQGLEAATAAWRELHLLPFYYHYFTTEAFALFSMGSVALLYSPLAVLGWARRVPTGWVLAGTGTLVFAVEAGKLFLAGLHPDPTNLLIAVAINATARALLDLSSQQRRPPSSLVVGQTVGQTVGHPVGQTEGQAEGQAAGQMTGPSASGASAWWLGLPVAGLSLLVFPMARAPLLAGVAVAAALVWRWPVAALALLPAALPVLDLAPWSGRLHWDEFDSLSMALLAVALHRTPALATSPGEPGTRRVAWAFALLGISLLASTARAMWPLPAPDLNSFVGYGTPYNALRIAKGAVWAGGLVLLWQRLAPQGRLRARAFGLGMALGLALTVVVVAGERSVFTSLLDFEADYRVTGMFSAMHKGGAFIECWLAVAAAFVLAGLLGDGRPWLRVAALGLLACTSYAMMVTYSRNGYAALVAVMAVSLLPWLVRRRGRVAWRALAWWTVAAAVVVATVLPIAGGGFARQRLAQSSQDLGVRQAHWIDGLRQRDEGLLTAAIGMGLGRFPDSHFWRSQEPVRAASFRLVQQGADRWLRLGEGATVYVEQIIPRPAGGALRLTMTLRASAYPASQAVMLCEKWTLTSLRCVQARAQVDAPPAEGAWQTIELALDATPLLAGQAWLQAPLKLSLATPAKGGVEIGDLQLSGPDGRPLLANGDFGQGMDRWFFATDLDPPWQLHSLPLTVLFDQGWLGVLAWSAVLAVALGRGLRLALSGQAQVGAALPAVVGFLVCGSLNTLIDAPRFLGLLLVLLWLAAARREPAPAGLGGAAPRSTGPPADPHPAGSATLVGPPSHAGSKCPSPTSPSPASTPSTATPS
jgi:VanZ family protein